MQVRTLVWVCECEEWYTGEGCPRVYSEKPSELACHEWACEWLLEVKEVRLTPCIHGLEVGCLICARHSDTCTRWGGRITCKDHGTQLADVPEFDRPRSRRTAKWTEWTERRLNAYGEEYAVLMERHVSGRLQVAPYAGGHCPSGEWPKSSEPHTVIGPVTKAVYKYKVPLYDWLGNVTWQTHDGVGGSWHALDVCIKWWVRKDVALDEEPIDSGEFTDDYVPFMTPTASGETSWRKDRVV